MQLTASSSELTTASSRWGIRFPSRQVDHGGVVDRSSPGCLFQRQTRNKLHVWSVSFDIVSLESSKNSSCSPPQTPTAAKAIDNFSRVTASLREAPVATLDPAIVAWGAPHSAERDSARAFLQTCTVPWPRHCAVPPEVSPFMIQPGLQWDLSKHGDSVTTRFDGISPESGRGSRRLASLLSPPLTVT